MCVLCMFQLFKTSVSVENDSQECKMRNKPFLYTRSLFLPVSCPQHQVFRSALQGQNLLLRKSLGLNWPFLAGRTRSWASEVTSHFWKNDACPWLCELFTVDKLTTSFQLLQFNKMIANMSSTVPHEQECSFMTNRALVVPLFTYTKYNKCR